MEISALSDTSRRLYEQAVRLRIAPFRVYFARLRRQGRRWIVEEAVAPVSPTDKQSLSELRLLVQDAAVPWAHAGTIAEKMGVAWSASLAIGEPLPLAAEHLDTLRALIRGRSKDGADVMNTHQAAVWLYPVTSKGSLRWGWVWRASDEKAQSAFPIAAYLSAAMGQSSGRLRVCRFCEGPFVAAHRWVRACKRCEVARGKAAKPEVRRVLDRLRKRSHGQYLRAEALADLRVVTLAAWKAKWDKKDPLGRGRHLGRRTRNGGE